MPVRIIGNIELTNKLLIQIITYFNKRKICVNTWNYKVFVKNIIWFPSCKCVFAWTIINGNLLNISHVFQMCTILCNLSFWGFNFSVWFFGVLYLKVKVKTCNLGFGLFISKFYKFFKDLGLAISWFNI